MRGPVAHLNGAAQVDITPEKGIQIGDGRRLAPEAGDLLAETAIQLIKQTVKPRISELALMQ